MYSLPVFHNVQKRAEKRTFLRADEGGAFFGTCVPPHRGPAWGEGEIAMADQQKLLEAYARLKALRANMPEKRTWTSGGLMSSIVSSMTWQSYPASTSRGFA